jgi:glycine/D-amino acid oxidase-like deaminating enzyme
LQTVGDWKASRYGIKPGYEEFHTRLYRRGMFERRPALLNPALLTRGLMRIAKEAGAVIHEMSPVISVEEKSSGFRIRTAKAALHADRLV